MPTDIMLTTVTPFAGVWIEMRMDEIVPGVTSVTPFAGVWIEIFLSTGRDYEDKSPPHRGSGIKNSCRTLLLLECRVTPFAGVWIEIAIDVGLLDTVTGHPLRGGVD